MKCTMFTSNLFYSKVVKPQTNDVKKDGLVVKALDGDLGDH